MQKTTKFNRIPRKPLLVLLMVLGFLIVVLILSSLIYANTHLSKSDTQSISVEDHGIHYNIARTPQNPVVGQQATFKARVIQGNKPISNTKFLLDIARAEGMTVYSTGPISEVKAEATTNSDREFTFSYVPSFDYGLANFSSFGIGPTDDFVGSQLAPVGANYNESYGVSMDFTVYPRWLGWFRI